MMAAQKRRLYGNMKSLSLWPTYIGEKRRTLGKTYGIKGRCDWEHPYGTHWEPVTNTGKMKKILLSPSSPKLKRK
jgi:hypothetical protein